jgi:hypothetical protein
MAGDKRKRVKNLEDSFENGYRDEDHERAYKLMGHRLRMAMLNEISDIRAPGPQRLDPATGRRTENLPSEAVRLWGDDKANWKLHELAANRVADNLDKYMSPGFNTGDDLRAYVPSTWWDPAYREELVEELVEGWRVFVERVVGRTNG